jgi:uncharacterized protein with HEPN domain
VTRSDDYLLADLFETAEKLELLVAKGNENFLADFGCHWAIERALLNIGEFCTHLSVDFKAKYPNIPWKEVVGMRTQLAHAYHLIDSEIVWTAASESVPALVKALKQTS